jgi:hypothetical protein
MMKMVLFKAVASACILASAAVIGGCASAPTQQQQQSADYGRPMTPSECLGIAQTAIADQLKDPSSAQFRSEAPCHKGYSNNVPLLGKSAQFGYIQNGEVNGKNSFGGYVGFRPYHVLMRNGAVVASCITDANGLCL